MSGITISPIMLTIVLFSLGVLLSIIGFLFVTGLGLISWLFINLHRGLVAQLKEQKVLLMEIDDEVKKTNGRVSAHEVWRTDHEKEAERKYEEIRGDIKNLYDRSTTKRKSA